MTLYTYDHLQCDASGPKCQQVLTVALTKNGEKLPGVTPARYAGWKTVRANKDHPRKDFCPVCVRSGLAK